VRVDAGLGRACAEALAAEGVVVVVNGRHDDTVAQVAAAIAGECATEVRGVAADLSDSAGRQRLLAACPDPDILVTNNAGPPPAVFTDVSAEAWADALQANMLGPSSSSRACCPACGPAGSVGSSTSPVPWSSRRTSS